MKTPAPSSGGPGRIDDHGLPQTVRSEYASSCPDANIPPSKSTTRRFSRMPNQACSDRRLKVRHYQVLMAICRCVNAKGWGYPGQAKIAAYSGRPRTKVSAIIDDLVKWEYVIKVPRISPNGRRTSNGYLVTYLEGDMDRVTKTGKTL